MRNVIRWPLPQHVGRQADGVLLLLLIGFAVLGLLVSAGVWKALPSQAAAPMASGTSVPYKTPTPTATLGIRTPLQSSLATTRVAAARQTAATGTGASALTCPGTPSFDFILHLCSDEGDWVGQGREWLLTPADTKVTSAAFKAFVTPIDNSLHIDLWTTDENGGSWSLSFGAPRGGHLAPGLYNPAGTGPNEAGLDIYGGGNTCSETTGWFEVNRIDLSPDGLSVVAFDGRFAQYCVGSRAGLFGTIHFDNSPSGPSHTRTPKPTLVPTPTPTWTSSTASCLKSRPSSYLLHVCSEPGDGFGQGRKWLLTLEDSSVVNARFSELIVPPEDNTLWIDLWTRDEKGFRWSFKFGAPHGQHLVEGTYHDARDFGRAYQPTLHFFNHGGIDCQGRGTFVINKLDVNWETLSVIAFDADFSYYCDYSKSRLIGSIHIDKAADTPTPRATQTPTATPTLTSSTSACLEESVPPSLLRMCSEPGNFIGQGRQRTLTSENSGVRQARLGLYPYALPADNWLSIWLESDWLLDFRAPPGKPLTPGTYTGVGSPRSAGPFQASLSVWGDGRACDQRGTFTIQNIRYDSDLEIEEFDADFALYCEGSDAGLFGKVHLGNATPPPVDTPVSPTASTPTATPTPVLSDLRASLVSFLPFLFLGNPDYACRLGEGYATCQTSVTDEPMFSCTVVTESNVLCSAYWQDLAHSYYFECDAGGSPVQVRCSGTSPVWPSYSCSPATGNRVYCAADVSDWADYSCSIAGDLTTCRCDSGPEICGSASQDFPSFDCRRTPSELTCKRIVSSILGDVDNSGTVDSLDALWVLWFVADMERELPNLSVADVSGEGQVNSIDANLILQVVAGLWIFR